MNRTHSKLIESLLPGDGIMRPVTLLAILAVVLSWTIIADCQAGFIQPTSISTPTSTLNTPSVLINHATGNGGASYVAPDPSSGGSGTSWYAAVAGTTPVVLSFNFAATTDTFSEIYMWDYYTHSPSDWTVKLYSGLNATGTELLDFDFSIIPGPSSTSTKTALNFTNVSGVLSGILETRNNSVSGGVGLAEFGFLTEPAPAPEPSSLLLLGFGAWGLMRSARGRRVPV
jgi:hypothetical protein